MAEKQFSDLDFQNAARITNLPSGVATGQPVTYEQLNAVIEGLAWKDDVRIATQSNINLVSPGFVVHDGVTLNIGDRVLVRNQTTQSENGIYIYNTSSTAMVRALDANAANELLQATVPVNEGTDGGKAFRQTAVNITLGTTALVFVQFGVVAGQATETATGIAELATQAETDAGTDDLRIVTPLKLSNWSNRKRRTSIAFGDGSTQYDLTHNFGTNDVLVIFRESISGTVANVEWKPLSTNTIRVNTSVGVSSNGLTAVILA